MVKDMCSQKHRFPLEGRWQNTAVKLILSYLTKSDCRQKKENTKKKMNR